MNETKEALVVSKHFDYYNHTIYEKLGVPEYFRKPEDKSQEGIKSSFSHFSMQYMGGTEQDRLAFKISPTFVKFVCFSGGKINKKFEVCNLEIPEKDDKIIVALSKSNDALMTLTNKIGGSMHYCKFIRDENYSEGKKEGVYKRKDDILIAQDSIKLSGNVQGFSFSFSNRQFAWVLLFFEFL